MLWESFHSAGDSVRRIDITRGFQLLVLSVATSLDALAVGLSFAFLQVNMLVASLTIGVVAFVVTVTGFIVGRKSSKFMGKWAESIGGVILIVIGLRILLTHVL